MKNGRKCGTTKGFSGFYFVLTDIISIMQNDLEAKAFQRETLIDRLRARTEEFRDAILP